MSGTFHTWAPWVPGNTNTTAPTPTPTPTTSSNTSYYCPPGYYVPGAYYRSAQGQPLIPNQNPQGMTTIQVNPAPQNPATQINGEPKATEIDIPPSDAQNGTCEHDGLKGSKIEEEKHVDLVTYDIDVEKIVQAVLSIEPKSTVSLLLLAQSIFKPLTPIIRKEI